ncbi:MAG TPA: GtrA family protein [Casimicrobiaceae bacterium]|jgi:putative flippase GtrA|nr:GtrA family protein [Casimicrobiaceae bacterium]
MKFIDASAPRFVAAGAVNTAATYAAYLALLQIAAYRVAFTLAFVAGILLSYALNARFVFRRPASWRSAWRFPLIYLLQYALGLALVSVCVEWLQAPTWFAPLMALVVTVPLTYLAMRKLFLVEARR